MKTFLFAWNPKKWNWTTLEQSIDQIEQTGRATEKWSVISHKKIQTGDRAFLMRLGEEPKGIMAAGFVSTPPFLSKHWNGEDKLVNRVMIDFEVILNPEKEPLLSLDILNQGNLAKVNWTPQSSGIEISPEVTDELEAVWFDFLTTQEIRHNPFKETEKDEQKVYTEGTPNQVLVTKYERNPYARKTCIDHYGLTCSVCKFNFENEYGELGKGFIHVHHLKQVADIGKEYKIDPIKDLRPVCPNCHAMIHKRKDPYTIEELKQKMNQLLNMFTIEQIHQAFGKVKSGTDFPQFVQDLKEIGVIHYDNFVSDGRTKYYGINDFILHGESKYPKMEVNIISSADKLKHAISIHQQGQTDYPTFCQQASDAGVEKWTNHMIEMTVTYFDKKGNKLTVEPIPQP